MKMLKTESEKQRDKNIRAIQKSISNLKKEGYVIEAEAVETIFGRELIHIYARIKSSGKIWEQKFLFTLNIETK